SLSACTVREYGYRTYGTNYATTGYQYYGSHPVPVEYGGGWCFNEGSHWHEYPANTSYAYSGSYYTYSGPTELYYYDYHPIPSGGYCYIHGRHSHNYLPGSYANNYYWDNNHNNYVYGGPDYHAATPVNSPPYSNNGYVAPPP